jgi:hypothetical protein
MTIHQAKGLEFPVVFVPDLAARTGGAHQPVAHWDSRLGCVARPPADEDPPPFPDFAARLWKAREAVEEWHEDLRTLYVACTRAQDYLVLSASLSDGSAPETGWMPVLAERFDLRSGDCLGDDVPPAERPQVRVTEGTDLPLSRERSIVSRIDDSARYNDSGIAPVPVRLSGKRLFAVAEIEGWLSRRGKRPPRPEDVAPQFDSEDGSDRRDWQRGTRDNIADPWLRAELGRARAVLLDVEFLIDMPEGAAIRGRIDCLWDDEDGGRHLLTFAPDRSRKRRGTKREGWPLGVVLAAVAVQRQSDTWPRTVTVYDPATGGVRRGDGDRLPHAEALAEAAAAVSALRRETLPA